MTETNQPPTYRITDLQDSDRPRERLTALGPQVLSNAELIAILLRVGVPGENAVQVGQRLLTKFRGLNGLHRAPIKDLCNQHGIGEAKAAQIKAAIELGRRLMSESPEERPSINSPADAADIVEYASQKQQLRRHTLFILIITSLSNDYLPIAFNVYQENNVGFRAKPAQQ